MTSDHPEHLTEKEAKQLWARALELQTQKVREEEAKSGPKELVEVESEVCYALGHGGRSMVC